jgi:uncharacterized surface protein with fasciclin (FAS1) repeats
VRPTLTTLGTSGRATAGAPAGSALVASRITAVLVAALLAGLAGCGHPAPPPPAPSTTAPAAPAPPGAVAPATAPPATAAPGTAPPGSPGTASPATPSGGASPASETPAPGGVTNPGQVFGAGCASLPGAGAPGSLTAMAGQPVAAALAGNPELTSLSTLLKKANLVDAWNSQPAATVFAPTNQAFAELKQTLGADQFAALLADQNKLADLLKYQLAAHRYDRAGLLAAQTVSTEDGSSSLRTATSGATTTVTDGARRAATVLCGNIPTANATVFLLDKVLLPRQP